MVNNKKIGFEGSNQYLELILDGHKLVFSKKNKGGSRFLLAVYIYPISDDKLVEHATFT
jgi:hypothetical protein